MKWMRATDTTSQEIVLPFSFESGHYSLSLPPHPFSIYTVTRVNPLFIEENSHHGRVKKTPQHAEYASNHDPNEYLHESAFHPDALAVLKYTNTSTSNCDIIGDILVSVRVANCSERASFNQPTCAAEAKADCKVHLVPSPIWPANKIKRSGNDEDEHNDGTIATQKLSTTVSSHHRHQRRNMQLQKTKFVSQMRRHFSVGLCIDTATTADGAKSSNDPLAATNVAISRTLRDKINECLGDSSPLLLSSPSSPASSFVTNVTVCSESRHADNEASTFCGGVFHCTNSLDESSCDEYRVEKKQLERLERLDKLSCLSQRFCERGQNKSNSVLSSATGTSGFCDLTQAQAQAQAAPTLTNKNNVARLFEGDLTFGEKKTVSFGTLQYRVVQNHRCIYSLTNATDASALSHVVDICAKSDTLLSSYPGHRCPDFTLDVHEAEKIIRKIKHEKKERCCCRLVTWCVGFLFLLFSVIFFSMMLTRGEKIFGSL